MFTVSNGVRQGDVSSAILFALYIDELLNVLRQAKIGSHIDGIFYGALVFTDDILLLSASCSGLQAMVNLCQSFVAQKNLKFGTHPNPDKSKTKCIVFSKKRKDHLDLHPVHLKLIHFYKSFTLWIQKLWSSLLFSMLLCSMALGPGTFFRKSVREYSKAGM